MCSWYCLGSARICTGPTVVRSVSLLSWAGPRHGLSLHQYADYMQFYISTPDGDTEAAVRHLSAYIIDIKAWQKASQLRLNPTKTQVMCLGSPQQLAKVNVSEVLVASAHRAINSSETVRNLSGVIVDSQLTLSAQVSSAKMVTDMLPTCFPLVPTSRARSGNKWSQYGWCAFLPFLHSSYHYFGHWSMQTSATSCLNLTKWPANIPVLLLRKELPVCHTGPYHPTSIPANIDDLEQSRTTKTETFGKFFFAISDSGTHFKSELCQNGWR